MTRILYQNVRHTGMFKQNCDNIKLYLLSVLGKFKPIFDEKNY